MMDSCINFDRCPYYRENCFGDCELFDKTCEDCINKGTIEECIAGVPCDCFEPVGPYVRVSKRRIK